MLRTTNKKVIERLRQHVLEDFTAERYNIHSDNTPEENLTEQLNSMMFGRRSVYATALDYVEGGSLLVYYDSVRKFLKEILEETDEESERFTDEKVWRLYCHLVARTMAKIYSEGEK